MSGMQRLILLFALVLTACPADDTASDTEVSTDSDSDTVASFARDCPALAVDLGNQTANGECVEEEVRESDGSVIRYIRADCTDEDITASLDKRHVVMRPSEPTRDVLWVHFGGTGGQPTNTTNIGQAAVSAGYRYISLAYTNDTSLAERCQCPDGPRPPDCGGLVRHEVIYGDDVTDLFDMQADEAIVPRLTALLDSLHASRPGEGWDAYLTGDGGIEWSLLALSGFSQGGGMASILSRNHAVDRVLFFSKAGDTVMDIELDPSLAQPCSSGDECASGACCSVETGDCANPPEDAVCLIPVPAPTSLAGADTDMDGYGDGPVTDRATDVSRLFMVIHREEPAWLAQPDVLSAFGHPGREAYVDADTTSAPYAEDVRLFSTARAPRNNCSEHQSMGANSCQPRDGNGDPAMREAWLHAMTTNLD